MTTPNFYRRWDRPPRNGEVNNGDSLVESAGYIPEKKRIESILLAGKKLLQARQDRFDFPDGDGNFDDLDPTRSGDYDLADASMDLGAIEERLVENAESTNPEESAVDNAEDPPDPVSDETTPTPTESETNV
jgi:hypothetical protein